MNDWIKFEAGNIKETEGELYQVFCVYNACECQCVAYVGDNGFFYSEETDKLLPVTHYKPLGDNPQ